MEGILFRDRAGCKIGRHPGLSHVGGYTQIVHPAIIELMAYQQKDAYLHLARYNERANRELFAVLSTLTDKARRRETGSWFGSLHGVLNHLIVADMYWLNRFKPVRPDSVVLNDPRLFPPELSWQHYLHEDFEGLKLERAFVDGRIIDWFEECPEDHYGIHFEYHDSAGTSRKAVAGTAFGFLFLHQSHHRGQIAQILDALGLPNNIADNVAFLEGPE